ncbi:helix-turn-helix transcriptional regulator [Paenibacillus sp. GYB003]|uniref:helix-turn-helix transcriptional regulator n=1 Tax=Paenibacillus sp. GYB003 TaxID=2994392 RepID=UPI002F96465F
MKRTVVIDIEFLTSLMKVKGLSESEFAHVIGVSHSMVNRVVNGKRGGGNKFIFGVLNAFADVSYSQLVKHDRQLPKGNKSPQKTA